MSNPFTSPLFVPTALRVIFVMGLGALLVVIAEVGRHRSPRASTLLRRVASWAMIAPLYILAVLSGPAGVVLLAAAVAFQGLRELVRLAGIRRPYSSILLVAGLVTPLFAVAVPSGFAWSPVAFLLAVSAAAIGGGEVDGALEQVMLSQFAFLYVPVLTSLLVVADRSAGGGAGLLLAIGMAVALSDVGAYTVGSLAGGPRLAPRLSPNKTWAGAAGNLAGASVGLAIMAFALPQGWSPILDTLLAALIGLGCVWGDLLESLIKRTHRVKDTADLLPGFGGLLDRVDSLLIVLPLSLLAVRLAGA